jgi:hypothetical protein
MRIVIMHAKNRPHDLSGLGSHFFNRPTLVLGFNQLFHNKKCNYWKEELLPGVICLVAVGSKAPVLGGY